MLQVSQLHNRAENQLNNAENPKKLALLHGTIALGSTFLLIALSELVGMMIADTGGLSGMGTRAIWSTVYEMLSLAVSVALPFWQLGIFFAALRWARKESAAFPDLMQGFRRWSSVAGVLLLQALIYIALGLAAAYISSTIFVMTPMANSLTELVAPLMDANITQEQMAEMLTPELMNEIVRASVPLLIILGVVFAIGAILVYYRTRFANQAVMDGHTALKALLHSVVITKGNCRSIFRVDLSFWWFYLLQILTVILCNADLLLQLLGVTLPVPAAVSTLVCYALGCACQILLLWQYEAKRVTVYALAYDDLATPPDGENSIITV